MRIVQIFSLLSIISFTFNSVFADQRSFAVFSDVGQFGTNYKLDELKDSLYHFEENRIVMSGDLVYERGESHWEVWGDWMEDFNFYAVAIGNHNQGYDKLSEVFGLPGEYYAINGEFYKFIVLNSDNEENAVVQANFLEEELENSEKLFNIVVYHHPFATISDYHEWEERWDFHQATVPIILKHRNKISAMIFGHDHVASVLEIGTIPVFISAAGVDNRRARYYDYYDEERDIQVKTHWNYRDGRYWLRMNLDSESREMNFDYIKIKDNSIDCSVKVDSNNSVKIQDNCWG